MKSRYSYLIYINEFLSLTLANKTVNAIHPLLKFHTLTFRIILMMIVQIPDFLYVQEKSQHGKEFPEVSSVSMPCWCSFCSTCSLNGHVENGLGWQGVVWSPLCLLNSPGGAEAVTDTRVTSGLALLQPSRRVDT